VFIDAAVVARRCRPQSRHVSRHETAKRSPVVNATLWRYKAQVYEGCSRPCRAIGGRPMSGFASSTPASPANLRRLDCNTPRMTPMDGPCALQCFAIALRRRLVDEGHSPKANAPPTFQYREVSSVESPARTSATVMVVSCDSVCRSAASASAIEQPSSAVILKNVRGEDDNDVRQSSRRDLDSAGMTT
jgi:hypothetical protein